MHGSNSGVITPEIPHSKNLIVLAPARRNHRGSKKKCITGLWDLNIPSDLLQEILSRLGLKANVQASTVCKTWCEAAVSVRSQRPLPWLFYLQRLSEGGSYTLFNPSQSKTYKQTFPELKGRGISCSRDGWLLVLPNTHSDLVFFFNPFTRERINLPERSRFFSGHNLAFSAAPTSSSCLVISFNDDNGRKIVIGSWRPGETVWTIHRFHNQLTSGRWDKCVFSNDVFYFLSNFGNLGVFDPSKATWNIHPVKPLSCPTFCQITIDRRVFIMEHEGDIFVMHMRPNNIPAVFKLNIEHNVLEEKSEVGGLTIFASKPGSFARAGLSAKVRNIIYSSTKWPPNEYCSLDDEEGSCLPLCTYLSKRVAWVHPPDHNYVHI